MDKCRKCKSRAVSYAEKKWYGWVWWCDKHYNERFCKQVESSPVALAKYWDIYGQSPSNL